jgi:hypothetical protein
MAEHAEGTLADRLFPKPEAVEYAESILSIPPEQRRLHTETYDFTISTITDYLKANSIFVPEFQRRYVWSDAQASRLIESLIIQCPIPVIYLSQEPDERMSVIDGNQRLRSLQRYLSNEFELSGLTAYPELDGLRFHQLDPRFQRHIVNRTLRCIVIMKDTHPQVKFDVFERLNTGAVKLTPQELRHGLYHGGLMKLIGKLAKDGSWRSLFSLSTDNKRMRMEEFVLRFFALHSDFDRYKKPLSAFLNDFAEQHRELTDQQTHSLTDLFHRTVTALRATFGDYTFKIFDKGMAEISPFNAALFDAEIIAISRGSPLLAQTSARVRKTILRDLAELFEDEEFQRAITRATSDEASLKRRVEAVGDVLGRHV